MEKVAESVSLGRHNDWWVSGQFCLLLTVLF